MNVLCYLLVAVTISAGRPYESTASNDSDESQFDYCPSEQQLCSVDSRNNTPVRCVERLFRATITGLVYCDAQHCEPETFKHDYVISNHDQSPHVNSWKRARVGESAILHDVCLLRNGLPVTRKCQVHGMRARWESLDQWPPVVCMRRFRERSISVELNNLHDDILEGRRRTNNTQERRRTTALIRDMFKQHDRTLLPADVHVVGQVFGELMEHEKDATLSADLISICREIMSSDAQVLQLSAVLNATNSLLNNFEDYMDALPQQLVPRENCGKVVVHAASDAGEAAASGMEILNNANLGVHAMMSSNLSVFYVNPECERITGIAIYSAAAPDRKPAVSQFWYRFLYANESLEKLRREQDLETATYVPEQLWKLLQQRGATYVILKVYAHDGLFVETAQQRSRRPRSKVLSISIPGCEGKSIVI